MKESAAFTTMKYLMFNLGFRSQYRPDMSALQVKEITTLHFLYILCGPYKSLYFVMLEAREEKHYCKGKIRSECK